jgi:hypothetical protein
MREADLSDHLYKVRNSLEFLKGSFTAMGSCDEGCFDPHLSARGATIIIEDILAEVYEMDRLHTGA